MAKKNAITTPSGAKVHGWVLGRYQPDPAHPRYVVDCKLYDMNTTRDVFWSDRKNSYVAVAVRPEYYDNRGAEFMERTFWRGGPSGWFEMASINGAGEVRWTVSKADLSHRVVMNSEEVLPAARHFGLWVNVEGCIKCENEGAHDGEHVRAEEV